jgi:ankyrin repeat protein
VAAYLLKKGLPVDAVDKEGHTPLHWAAYQNHREVALLLLKSGAGTLYD